MVMTVTKDRAFTEATRPVEMKRSCVAAGKPRKTGDVVEVNEKDFVYLTNTGAAIPHLGEAKSTKRSTRKKKDA